MNKTISHAPLTLLGDIDRSQPKTFMKATVGKRLTMLVLLLPCLSARAVWYNEKGLAQIRRCTGIYDTGPQ